ncbi:angiomotin-like protein 1 isoform 2-T3 [Clarias gariepinus]
MEPGDHWIPDDVAQWLDHIGIHQQEPSLDMLYGEVAQVFSGPVMHSSSDDAVVVSGPVLQRLMQENFCYGNGVGPENQAMASLSNPASTETPLPETQPRQEPQGQEHQVDSSSMEKSVKGAQSTAASAQVTLTMPGLGSLELPSYEEAKSQSQLYRGQQGQNEEQNMASTQTSVHSTGNTLTNPGHTYTTLKHTPQGVNSPNPGPSPQIQISVQPNQLVPTSTSSCPPSLSSAPSLSFFDRAEGRSWVQRGFTGVDEGLAGLEQGHVRSLSERIMQLSLERNGAKQPRDTSPVREERTLVMSSKTATPPPPIGSLEPRGPPPEYPYKDKFQPAYPSSISPGPLSPDQILPSIGAPLGQISVPSLMPPVVPQAGSGTRLPPQGQIVPAEAFSMMSHAQHMMTFLSDENQRLRQELLMQTEKTGKLQRVCRVRLEAEVQRLSDAYENLVRSSSKRETLDKTMRMKLEGEIRRLHDFNRDLRDRLETANRKLANQDAEGQEDGHVYLSERRESLKEMERLEMEAESLRSATEDQRRHIEILEQALNNAQGKVVRLEEELGRKCVYVERVERLQQALAQLQAACEKREQLEKRLRTRLERELETLRSQQRAGVGVCESSAPALMDLLREREERILGLEADRMRWEQKYLEESAMRQFAMEAAATAAVQRDTTFMQHSRSGSYSDACLWPHDGDDKTYTRRCQDIETRMKDLHAQLLEKIAMIKVLQHRSRRDSTPLRPARSVPSIAVATGLHSRQPSQTESVLLGKENHLPPSLPSFTSSLSSLVPSLSSSHPPSFATLSVSTLPLPSIMSSSLSSSLHLSSSATLPLPSTHTHSLPPLPPNVSSSLPSTPLLSLHSKSASRDSSTQTGRSPECVRATPPTGRGRTGRMDYPAIQMKFPESRVLHTAGQKIRPADSDLVEILI